MSENENFHNFLHEIRESQIFSTIDERATTRRIITTTFRIDNAEFKQIQKLVKKHKVEVLITASAKHKMIFLFTF